MKLAGGCHLQGSPSEVFPKLLDPELLKRCIPGCSALEPTGEGVYQASIKVGIGAVKGTFKAKFQLTDVETPTSYRLLIEGRSAVGHARGESRVVLAAQEGRTALNWEGEAKVSGLIAAVGQRLLGLAAQRTAEEFFENVARELGDS